MNLTKKDLVTKITSKLQNSSIKDTIVKEVIELLFNEITTNLKNSDKIELRNFGVFEVKNRKPKKGRNPKTKEEVMIPARRVVSFKPGKIMREEVEIPVSEINKETPNPVQSVHTTNETSNDSQIF